MTVSQCLNTETPSETLIDGMIRAGASMGYGVDDILVELTAAGFKLDRERVRSIVIPKRTAPSEGASYRGR